MLAAGWQCIELRAMSCERMGRATDIPGRLGRL